MRLVYAPSAVRDIDDILTYVGNQSPRGAESLSVAIEHSARICAEFPRAGARTNTPHTYRHPLRGYRFTMFYRFKPSADVVEIVRVVRGARVRNLRRIP